MVPTGAAKAGDERALGFREQRAGDGWGRGLGLKDLLVAGPA
jgi:hypothetical protein